VRRFFIYALSFLLLFSLSGCTKSETVLLIEKNISDLGDITLESGDALEDIAKMFDNVNAAESRLVNNASVFFNAKIRYAQLCIDDIGSVSLDSKEKIDHAKSAVDLLTEEECIHLDNINILNSAVEKYDVLKEKKVKETQAKLKNLNKEYDEFTGLTMYKPKVLPKYVNTRCYLLPIIGVIESDGITIPVLAVNYVYYGDDWIFFENCTVKADDIVMDQHFEYFDVNREIAHGDVYEFAQVVFPYIGEISGELEETIHTLRAIANSQKTMVRFSGENHLHTFTVNAADKAAIKEILDIFEGLILAFDDSVEFEILLQKIQL